jgi:hypothetical protein
MRSKPFELGCKKALEGQLGGTPDFLRFLFSITSGVRFAVEIFCSFQVAVWRSRIEAWIVQTSSRANQP